MLAVKPDGDYYAVSFQGFIYAFRQDQTFLAKSPAISIDNGAGDLSLRGDGFLAFGQSSVGQSSGTLNTFNLPLIDQTDQRESRRNEQQFEVQCCWSRVAPSARVGEQPS